MDAVAIDVAVNDRITPRPAVELTPWSKRVRWVGGLIQAAFAAFWMARGAVVIGASAEHALLVVVSLFVVGAFAYAIRMAAGTAPRPSATRKDKQIELQITVATVIEFAAAIMLPILVTGAGHSDWTLPSIAITVGPLLLWLDHRLSIPRYRPAGWALTLGPLALVATLSGTALVATTGLAGGLLLLGTALAGFHDLATVANPTEQSYPNNVVSSGVQPMNNAQLPNDGQLHVVFGAGQVGRALAEQLSERGLTVRVVSRTRPSALAEGIDWRAADATIPEAAIAAAAGASVVYQCLNAPYTDWAERFPPLQRGVMSAAEATGALLVSLENLYGYGPTAGAPMTEDLPLAANTTKGRTRALMTDELQAAAASGRIRIAIGRASDFFGAGVTESSLGERIFGNAVAGKRADFIGNPDLPHTYSYVPDIARALATLGTDERAVGGVWHLPGPETVTTTELLELTASKLGRPVGVRTLPKLAVRALGLINPTIRELVEMTYEFEAPFVLDTTKYESTFGTSGTPLPTAIAATITWYQQRDETRRDSEKA
jgi:nucleoside-diphosphate-sugar epimerase